MKLFTTLILQVIVCWGLAAQCSGGATQVDFENGAAVPMGWIVDDPRNTYWLLTDDAGSTPNGEGVITEAYDVSAFNRITINIDVATFNSGTPRSAVIAYSLDGGMTYESTTFMTATPSNSDYIPSGDFTVDIPLNIDDLVIQIYRAPGTGRDVRVRNFYLCGETLNTLPKVSFDAATYTVDEINGATNIQQVGVTLDSAPATDADVEVVDIAGTAAENLDYSSVAATLTFPAGGTYPMTQFVAVSILPDTEVEGNESFSLLLGVATNSSGVIAVGINETTEITIADDDTPSNLDIRINELDSDTELTADAGEFIELYSPNGGNYSLNGLVLVLFNGNGDKSYATYDLAGRSTDANGYFIIGTPRTSGPTFIPDISLNSSGLQNGADGVGLFLASSSDFPNNTPIATAANFPLIDGLVYETNDLVESELVAALDLVGEGQIDEDRNGQKDLQSIQRGSWMVAAPTPRAANFVLPIELSSFTATPEATSVVLDWQTAQERNNYYFTVEHSLDGKTFVPITEVTGNGTVETTSDYRYVHTNPAVGTNYYRLAQTDYDGTSETFEVRSVQVETGTAASIFPNPVQHEATLTFGREVTNGDLQLFDARGTLVRRLTFSGYQLTLDLSDLPSGAYSLQMRTANAVSTQRLIKR